MRQGGAVTCSDGGGGRWQECRVFGRRADRNNQACDGPVSEMKDAGDDGGMNN
jgi:hypothetical protein